MKWHIEKRKVSELIPDEHNPRVLTKKGLADLKKSVDKFGLAEPIIINTTGVIIGGHGRAKVLDPSEDVEVYVPERELTADEQKELNVRLNKNIAGEWDFDILANEFEVGDLIEWGFDEKDLKIDISVEEDEAPEVSTDPAVSQLGEVYQLGRHRVMCGDSVKTEDIDKLLGSNKADIVFTDPPWNVNYGAVKAGNKQGDKVRTIENDNMGEDFTPWMNAVFSAMSYGSKDGCMTYVVMSPQEWGGLMSSLGLNGYHWSSTIIWNKDHLVLSRKDYHGKYEPIWYGWKGDGRLHPLEDRKQSDVWDINRPTKSDEHPTMKPIELCARAVNNSSNPDDTVLDLFLGSGSTLIACEQTNRICYGMEIDPRYVDVIRKRYANFIGKEEEWQTITSKI
jgi:DNA modification methylase